MKKTLIALAIAGVSAAGVAQADNTTLYGSIRMTYQYLDDSDSSSTFENGGSRFGIKGSEDLGNGLRAFYKYENRLSDQSTKGDGITTKKLYVGVKGGFGTFTIGRLSLPYNDNVADISDPANDLTADYGFFGKGTASNALRYDTPDMNGFGLHAAVVADGQGGHDKGIDFYDVSVDYNANGIYAGLDYQSTNGLENEVSAITLGLGYNNDLFGIGLSASNQRTENGKLILKAGSRVDATVAAVDVKSDTDVTARFVGRASTGVIVQEYEGINPRGSVSDISSLASIIAPLGRNVEIDDLSQVAVRVGGYYNLSADDQVLAEVGYYDDDQDFSDDIMQYMVGYQHKLSKRTRVWAEYRYSDFGNNKNDNENVVKLGLRTDF